MPTWSCVHKSWILIGYGIILSLYHVAPVPAGQVSLASVVASFQPPVGVAFVPDASVVANYRTKHM